MSAPLDFDFDGDRWGTLLADIEGPTYNQVATAIAERLDVTEDDAFTAIADAIDAGVIEERDGPGALPWIYPTEETIGFYESARDVPRDVDAEPGGVAPADLPDAVTGDYGALSEGEALPSGKNFTPPTLQRTKWWVNWVLAYRFADDDGETHIDFDGGTTKQPVAPYMNGHARPVLWHAGLPDDEHPATDVETVERWSGFRLGLDLPKPDRVESDVIRPGVVLPVDRERKNPQGVTIIDWDDVRDPETGEIHPVALQSLIATGGYATISQSGEGIHQWVFGDLPHGRKFVRHIDDEPFIPGGDTLPAVEIYTTGRLVAMTGEHIAGTGRDVADGQDLINNLCWRFGTAGNNSPGTPTDPFADRRDGSNTDTGDNAIANATPSTERVGRAMREAIAYDGPDPETWDVPEDDPRPLEYHAVLRARERSDELTTTANWELMGYAAAYGFAVGLTQDDVVADLRAHPTPQYGFDERRARSEVRNVYRKMKHGHYQPPSRDGLADRGILPESYAGTDDPRAHTNDGEYIALLPEIDTTGVASRDTFGPLTAQRPDPDVDGTDHDGKGPLSVDMIRSRAISALTDAMDQRDQVVVDAVMGAGKTYGAFKGAHAREDAIFYASGRKALYEQGRDYALSVGFSEDDIYVLPSPDDCPTFAGEHGEAAKDQVHSLFGRGVRLATLHRHLDLPCCSGDTECEYQLQNSFDPDDYDVIIGHYKHAHIPRVTAGRHVIVDESPTSAFMTRVESDTLVRGINAFLALSDSPPVESFADLLGARHDPDRREAAIEWYDTAEGGNGFNFEEADEQNAIRFDVDGYHAYAPHAVYAILSAEPVGEIDGGDGAADGQRYPFEKASLPGIDHAALFFAADDQNGRFFVEIQTPPDLQYARSVIALDGTPLIDPRTVGSNDPTTDGYTKCDPAEWSLALGRPMRHRRILSDDERARFLRETMNHRYVQTSRHVRPYSSGKYSDVRRDLGLLAAASDRYLGGEPWDVTITSKKVEADYLAKGFADPDRGVTREMDHRGDVRGSDEYATCKSGVVLGSAHHGDHELQRRAAWLGEAVEGNGKGIDRSYGPVGDAVLGQMRELDTAQCALRIGRGKDGRGAIVLLDSAAIPEWIPVENRGRPGDVSLWAKGELAVHDAVGSIGTGATFRTEDVRELLADADETMTARHARRVLHRLVDRDLLRKERDPDDGRRWVWIDDGLAAMDDADAVVVSLPDLDLAAAADAGGGDPDGRDTDIPRIESYTQNVRIFPFHFGRPSPVDHRVETAVVRADGGSREPTPPDKSKPDRRVT